MGQFDLRAILTVVGGLTLTTALVTEILKQVFWHTIPTRLLAIIVAEGLTLGAGILYAAVMGATVLWYHVTAAVVAGLSVAYSATYGFDLFVEIERAIKKKRNKRRGKHDQLEEVV